MALSNFEKHKLNFVCLCFYHHHHHHHFMGTNMCQMRGGWENNEDKYLVQDMRQYEQMMRMYVSSQGPRPGFMTQVNNVWNLWVLSQKKCKNNRCCLLVIQGWYISRVRRVFQLRVGLGYWKNISGWVGLGTGYLYQIPIQLGIIGYCNLEREFAEYLPLGKTSIKKKRFLLGIARIT